MKRVSFINTSSLTHAAADTATAGKAVEKVVYMSADASLKSVVVNVANAADATLRLIGSMVVHLTVRTYHHDDNERRKFDAVKEELLAAFKEYAETKRGRPFQNAWVSRLMNASVAMCRSLVSDYDKKGIQPGSPLESILRCKTPEAGLEVVMKFIMAKTKGEKAFTALEAMLTPKKAKAQAPVTGKGSNATKPSTDKADRIGARIVSETGHEAINAIKGNAKAKALKMATTIGKSNVDHLTFVVNSLKFLTTIEDLMAVAQAATDLAKEMQALADKGEGEKAAA